MANTYTQIYIHIIFSPKNKAALINREWRDELHKYISGIIQNKNHKVLCINSQPDHIHIFIGYSVNQLIPELVEDIKTSSNKWINDRGFCRGRFDWQLGYGAFSHSRSQIDKVVKYILNQDLHHAKRSFKEEYLEVLKNNDIKFEGNYLFEFFE
jgi:putative transposase